VVVRLVRCGTLWYVWVCFDAGLYVWYALIRFGTSVCLVGFFDMKLSLEGNFLYIKMVATCILAIFSDSFIVITAVQLYRRIFPGQYRVTSSISLLDSSFPDTV
jgi:hypothetical protein